MEKYGNGCLVDGLHHSNFPFEFRDEFQLKGSAWSQNPRYDKYLSQRPFKSNGRLKNFKQSSCGKIWRLTHNWCAAAAAAATTAVEFGRVFGGNLERRRLSTSIPAEQFRSAYWGHDADIPSGFHRHRRRSEVLRTLARGLFRLLFNA